MKDAYYFPHDCNARNDQKLVAVRAVYGMQGYGIYFGLIEMLREANGYQISSKINLLAFDLREEEKIIKDILENYDLFKSDGVIFWSETLNQRMGHLSEVREKRRLAGKEGGLAKARVLLQQKPSKSVAVKESKVKESIIDPTPRKAVFKAPTHADIAAYCQERGNAVDPDKFLAYYEARGWQFAKNKPVKDWKACVRTWEARDTQNPNAVTKMPIRFGES